MVEAVVDVVLVEAVDQEHLPADDFPSGQGVHLADDPGQAVAPWTAPSFRPTPARLPQTLP